MEPISDVDLSVPHYFIPHHHVLKPSSSTTKLRVVFDASSKTSSGVSLNELLLVGPAIQTDLLSTVLRFRYYTYVFTADISKMYRQVSLHPNDRRFHYILWRSDGRDPIAIYQLCTVTYDTTSASFLATRALRQLCIDEQHTYPRAADAAIHAFYVDDILTGANTLSEAIDLQFQLKTMLAKGGFELRKWCANHTEILNGTPDEGKEKFFQIKGDNAIKTLGVIWNPFIDKFLYEKPDSIAKPATTKRSVLSQIAQLFDPQV
ncbi:PREDICTED: uncharacterized protein LOC108379473 [Rhagoletis zephyria]|uniref:uncharacterized protein LOC108379473 n=1 Tax=Rhagoletis zephyria TaxID=28612 RepID=UPI000811A135|nr:PREDICTED: uncharacterized protein LOC108379473 [Rhagoletis zephyria]